MKPVIDVCCGSRMFYFNKADKRVLFCDKRFLDTTLCDGRKLEIKPDIMADFRNLPFPDESFYLVVFDPPHLSRVGHNSWLAKKYGFLSKDKWKEDLAKGFNECMRVLKCNGTLVFKWNEEQIRLSEVLNCFSEQPLFGHKRNKTHFLIFYKSEEQNESRTKRNYQKVKQQIY